MDADVIVVGAGPAGLMLAGELRLGGAHVIVLERLLEPTGQSRGLGFNARAVEVFDQRGLLPLFGSPEISSVGHFGGVQFDYSVLPGAHFGARGIPQFRTEAALQAWAAGLGADIRRGWECTGVADNGERADVTARTDAGVRRLRASYLVGCDGGHSTVRRLAGFSFPGTAPTRGMFLADVAGCQIRPRFLGERVPGGMVMAAPLGGDRGPHHRGGGRRAAAGRARSHRVSLTSRTHGSGSPVRTSTAPGPSGSARSLTPPAR